MLYFEDFPVGRMGDLPPKSVSRDEIVAFARAFDPQPMHLDEAAASKSMHGGLAASGWHSCAMLMRMICDGFLLNSSSMGSPGLAEVKWLKPVKLGDTLTATYQATEARISAKRPEMGIVRLLYDMHNQDGVSVMTWDCTQLFAREGGTLTDRPPGKRQETSPVAAPAQSGSPQPFGATGNLFLEDYTIGEVIPLGSHTFTAQAIKDFATAYDPQPFHLDEAVAERSLFAGLSASGWHTAAVWMKQLVATQSAAIARVVARGERPGRLGPSPGFRNMRWFEPVRPGDAIAYSTRPTGSFDWPGRPAWGELQMTCEGRNQHGRVVFSFDGRVLVERRTPAPV